jgi:hypothetical protein
MTTPPLWGAPLPEAAIVEPPASLGQANEQTRLDRFQRVTVRLPHLPGVTDRLRDAENSPVWFASEWEFLTQGREVRVLSALSPDQALLALKQRKTSRLRVDMRALAWSRRRVVTGHVTGRQVRLVAMRPLTRNSWRPEMRGSLSAVETGSELQGRVRVPLWVRVFMAAWFAFLAVMGLIGVGTVLAGIVTGHGSWAVHGLAFTGGVIGLGVLGAGLTATAVRAGLNDVSFLMGWLGETLDI